MKGLQSLRQRYIEMSFRNRVTLRDAMKGIIEEPLLPLVPKRFDYIGDIAVISIPAELGAYREAIVLKILSMRGNTRAVLNKVSKLEGERRVAHFELLSGESAETFHRENGYTYRMDVRKVFFQSQTLLGKGTCGFKSSPGRVYFGSFCRRGSLCAPFGRKRGNGFRN